MLKYTIMLGLFLVIISAIFAIIISGFAYPAYLLIRKINPVKGDWFAYRFVQIVLAYAAFITGASATYIGLENLPEKGEDAVVYVANHRSLFDIVLTVPKFKGLTGALAKIELEKTPLVGWWIKTIHSVLLDRNDKRQGLQCVLECIKNINNGYSMLVFPEGTRSHTEGELLPFHKGTFKIATKPGARIIPVAINGTGDIFDDHRPFIKPHKAVIEFCEPIDTKSLSPEELLVINDIVQNIIAERMKANAHLVK